MSAPRRTERPILSADALIRFRHPGYSGPGNVLLRLPRMDETGQGVLGVHHGTARVACQIIAGNEFGGRFALNQDGSQTVDAGPDAILIANDYYFFVEEGVTRYPVAPSFRDWIFPICPLPEPWAQASWASADSTRCCLTDFSFAVEAAHIVPQQERIWFAKNMINYCLPLSPGIDDSANIIPLRSDVYSVFDQGGLVIVPKTQSSVTQLRGHLLDERAREYRTTLHDVAVQGIPQNSVPFLFARFAWAVLLCAKPFVTNGDDRVVRVNVQGQDGSTDHKVVTLPGLVLMKKYGGNSSKDTATKRRPSTSSGESGSLVTSFD